MNKAIWTAAMAAALAIGAAQGGGYLSYQKASHMFSSGVKAASSATRCPPCEDTGP